MVKMVGPGGAGHCSKFNCLETAVTEQVYAVAHPYRPCYDVTYWWCSKHDHTLDRWVYPNFELTKETR